MQRVFQFSPILSTLWKFLHFWALKHTHSAVLHFSHLACSLPPQAMSSLDLISCGRVSLGQRVLERVSMQRLGGAGITSGISAGGILSFGVHPKITLPCAGWIHKCNPSSSHPTGPWRSQAGCQVSPAFHRVNISVCWAPGQCVPPWHMLPCNSSGRDTPQGLGNEVPSAPSPPTCHLPNKQDWGRRNPEWFSPEDVGT